MRKTNENKQQSQTKNCGHGSKDCGNKESGAKNCGKNSKNCK